MHPAFRSGQVTVPTYTDFPRLPRVPLWRRITREARALGRHFTLRAAAGIIALSPRAVRDLELVHGVHASMIRGGLPAAVTPRVDASSLRAQLGTGDAPVILSVCRLSPERRLDLLIGSFAAIRSRGRDAWLVIAGRGSEEPYLQRLVAALGLADRVRFVGFVPDEDLVRYHSLAHVFAAPVLTDSSIAVYEALAAGCNVVVTTEMALDDVVRDSQRVVVCEPEERDLARALGEALDRPLGPPPPLEHLTWEARTIAVESLYREIVARTAAR
jgi:glycosyltransferase involved in cell wall biosynthesis